MPRAIAIVLPDTGFVVEEYTSTISSSAVSGSITIVYVCPAVRVLPPISAAADTTLIDALDDVIADDSVVFCERDEYFLTVIDGSYRL